MLTRLEGLTLISDSTVRGSKAGAHMVKSNLFMKLICPKCDRYWMSGKGTALLNFKAEKDG